MALFQHKYTKTPGIQTFRSFRRNEYSGWDRYGAEHARQFELLRCNSV